MNKYSRAEQQVMRAAFKHLFNVSDEFLNAPAIEKWMADAPVGIVEYDGRLKGEGTREKDRRMEIIDVYDGNVGMLVEHLRRIYKEYRKLTKWELIFKTYNEISAAQKSIEQAELQVVFNENEATGEVPQETEELMAMIRKVRDYFKISVLLIEHDMKLVMGICERITVLNFGQLLAQGLPAEIQSNKEVIKAYIGE